MPDSIISRLPIPRRPDQAKCAGHHFGAWAVEPQWFNKALSAVRAGTLKPKAFGADDGEDDGDLPEYELKDGIAYIAIEGAMMKGRSSFGGCCTVDARRDLRAADADPLVRGIMLRIDSPGGTVNGTPELADEVAKLKKPCFAMVEGMCCSAAYWVASQADRIIAGRADLIGSIGVYAVLEDSTGMQEQWGIKSTVVSTGPFKGLGADGKVSDALVSDVQREVNDLNEHFLAAVADGRGVALESVRTLADGRVHVGDKAMGLGLVDEIGSLDMAVAELNQEIQKMNRQQFDAFAAENPDAVKSYIEQGRKQGEADAASAASAAQIERMNGIAAAFGISEHPAVVSFAAGHDVATAKLIADAGVKARAEADATAKRQAEEIEKLKAQIGTQSAVAVAGNIAADAKPAAPKVEASADPVAQAKAEWKADAKLADSFISEDVYVAYRAADLRGQVTRTKAE